MKTALFRSLLLVCLPGLLSACAGSTYQARHGNTVRSAVVAEQVPKPARMHYRDLTNVVMDSTVGAVAGAGAGLVGGVVYSVSSRGVSRGSARNLEEAMTLNDIRVDDIVRRVAAEELTRSGLFPGGAGLAGKLRAGQPDVVLRLEIEDYGFGQSGFLQRGLVPVLKVEGTLVRVANNEELWSESMEVDTRNRYATPRTYEEYRQNPALIREAFTIAARAVVADMVRNMKGEKELN